ncbi:hypothetical protein ACFL3F_03045 [Planctomycetota bacterium]
MACKAASYGLVQGAYKEAQTDLEQILRIRPSVRVLEDMNASMAKDVADFRSSQPTPSPETEGEILVVTGDCKGVRIRGAKTAESENEPTVVNHARKRGPRPGTKREACVGSVYSIDRFKRSVDDIVNDVVRKKRTKDRPVPQNKILRAELTYEQDGVEINGKDVIFAWFGEQIEARRTSSAQEIVCAMDGAPTLWKKLQQLMKQLRVTIVCILDLFHVMDYLWDAARCVHGSDDKAAEAFVTDRLRRILEGDVGRVIGGFKQMLAKDGQKKKSQRKFSATQRKTMNTVIHVFYTAFMVWTSTTTAYDHIDTRLLSPLYPSLVIIIASLLKPDLWRSRILSIVAVAWFSLFLITVAPFSEIYTKVNSKAKRGAGGYNTQKWQKSDTIAYFRRNGQPTDIVYSNAPGALFILAHVTADLSPAYGYHNSDQIIGVTKENLFLKHPALDGALLVWFDRQRSKYLFSPNALKAMCNLETIETMTDGTVFRIRRTLPKKLEIGASLSPE